MGVRRRIAPIATGIAVLAVGVYTVATRPAGAPGTLRTTPGATPASPVPTLAATPSPPLEFVTPHPLGSNTRPKERRSEVDPDVQQPSMSLGARVVAFTSLEPLITGDTNRWTDVFVRSRTTHRTSRISISTDGKQANGGSGNPAVSAGGTRVAFISQASNLVPGDTNGVADVFVRDLVEHTTVRVSVSSVGGQGNAPSGAPSVSTDGRVGRVTTSNTPAISADGRFVAFESTATNLVAGDDNDAVDVFVHDLGTGKTVVASVAMDASTGNGESLHPSISGDGRFVTFDSSATDLIEEQNPNSSGPQRDVYIRDMHSGTTQQISVTPEGKRLEGQSLSPSISPSGRLVAFIHQSHPGTGDENWEVLKATMPEGRIAIIASCGVDICDRVVVAGDGTVGYVKALGGLDRFCQLHPANSHGYVSYCPSGWMTLSPDGRYVGVEADIDALSHPKDEERFGGHKGALIYDRETDRYTPAWKI